MKSGTYFAIAKLEEATRYGRAEKKRVTNLRIYQC